MKLIALDVGTKRIGVAKADTNVKIAVPHGVVLAGTGQEFAEIARIAREYGTTFFVIGLPRNNSGLETAQSAYVKNFARQLTQVVPHAKVRFQDESLTSVEAETRLGPKRLRKNKGDIDAEAATIILQDFLDSYQRGSKPAQTATTPAVTAEKPKKKILGKVIAVIVGLLILCAAAGAIGFLWYNNNLAAVSPGAECAENSSEERCQPIKFSVKETETVARIADNLAAADLIRSPLAFKLYVKFTGHSEQLKTGEYTFNRSMTVEQIVAALVEGRAGANVFNFTILPGETIADIKEKLLKQGYSQQEIDAAFAKEYDHPVLQDKPAGVSLEGYLYGETYQFFNDETVENIITRTLDELWEVVQGNDLINKFKEHNLNLHQGLTIASIVQKEAKTNDQPGVAQVFLSRLGQGIALGSDVTATYAADLVDPERKELTDNALVLAVDSPYNTRKYSGLPPGPIASPSVSAMNAVANPRDASYLYFLTGDDGKMYYSYTEAEHQQKAAEHCRSLCAVSL